jgi:hypothetical protein
MKNIIGKACGSAGIVRFTPEVKAKENGGLAAPGAYVEAAHGGGSVALSCGDANAKNALSRRNIIISANEQVFNTRVKSFKSAPSSS